MAADAAMPAAPRTYSRNEPKGIAISRRSERARGSASLLAIALVFSLAACVNLTPPWNGVKLDGATSSTDSAGGSSGLADGPAGGAAGLDGGVPSSFDGGVLDLSSGDADASPAGSPDVGRPDLPADKGETGSAVIDTAGAPDAPSRDVSGDVADAPIGPDAPEPDGPVPGGGEDASDASPDADVDTDADVDAAPLPDLAEVASPDLPEDLGPDLQPDTADLAPLVCNTGFFDAKTLQHTNGYAESDGWYLAGSGQFMYSTNVSYLATKTKMTVVARGDYVSNQWPTMQASAGQSNIVGTATVSSNTMTAYTFTFDALTSYAGIGVTVTSGAGLHVQSIALSCP